MSSVNIQEGIDALANYMIPHSDELVKSKLTPELCKKCKGACCKRMGCEISPSQIKGLSKDNSAEKQNTEIILKVLKTGIISVDWWIAQDREYYLRMRNVDANVIDPSFGGQCMCLSETGCMLEDKFRPMTGLDLCCVERDGKFYADENQCRYDKEGCKNEWLEYPVDWDMIFDINVDEEEFESDIDKALRILALL